MRRMTLQPGAILFCFCFFFCGLLLLAGAAAPAAAEPHPVATIIAERGTLFIQPGGAGPFQVLTLQRPLLAGDVLRSGPQGEAEILFQDGSQVKLDANASLRIALGKPNRPGQNLFQALLGVIWAHLRPGQGIQTPTANIVVRGTEVLLAVAGDGTTTLTVTEGDVSFFNAQGTVEVAAAQQSVARPGQAPTPPVAVDASGLIAWTADVAGLPLEFEMPSLAPGGPGTDYAAEEARYAAATSRAPSDAEGWIGLGNARRGLGDLPGALAAFAQATQIAPDNLQARVGSALSDLTQGRTQAARDVLTPVQTQSAALAVIGLADLHAGKAADAETHLQAALAKDPTLYAARALLALALLTRADLPDAEAAARAAVRTEPNAAQTQGTLAMVLFFAGKSAEAEAASRQAVRLNPGSTFALLTEGRSLLARQQTDAARADFEKAAAIAPYLWLAHEELGRVYLRLDMPPKAGEEYRIALALNPDAADAFVGLGEAEQAQGRFVQAEAEFRRAVGLDQASTSAHYALAALLIDRGRLDQARKELESGVQAAPERGILYARLAEVSLYQQDLFGAQALAQRAVRLLPDSALAHYELGRVYLEQDRTVQAEQEFRQATTLDRQFAPARYALGLTEEKIEGGLLNSFSSLLGSALVGSPDAVLSLGDPGNPESLETPGAEQRIQAALLDPTTVRVASRSYGDTQIDATLGERATRDLSGSFLSDAEDGRGVRGVTGEEQATNGVRANAGVRSDNATVVYGQKAANDPSAFFVTGDYQDGSRGVDDGILSDPGAATLRFHEHLSRLIAGTNTQSGENSRLRALVQVSRYLYGSSDSASAENFDHVDIQSIDGELRWDASPAAGNLFNAGFSLGSRRRKAGATFPNSDDTLPPYPVVGSAKLLPYQAYARDEVQVNPRLTLIGEMQVQRLESYVSSDIVGLAGAHAIQSSRQKTLGLPNVIVAYQPDTRTGIRLRARRLLASVSDFQLLAPTDVFLFSFDGLPQAANFFFSTPGGTTFPTSDGTSVELEYDHTFADASFLRVGAVQQDVREATLAAAGGLYAKSRVRSAGASYEGLLGRTVSFSLSGDFNSAFDSDTGLRIAQVPSFDSLTSVQYLDRAGFYAQTAFYYQGNRVTADDDRSHLGGFGVLNLRLGKRFGLRSNVFIELRNALNKQYDVYGVLQPSRQVVVGISQRL